MEECDSVPEGTYGFVLHIDALLNGINFTSTYSSITGMDNNYDDLHDVSFDRDEVGVWDTTSTYTLEIGEDWTGTILGVIAS